MADRTNGLNNVDIGSGRRGFRNRNLGLGQAGTVMDAEWANGVQEEIVRLIEQLGLTPSPSNREQVLQAVRRLAGGNVTTVSANTTLTADNAGVVLASASGGNVTITLPAANGAGGLPQRLTIVRTDTSGNTLNLVRGGSDTINGLTTSCPLPVGASVTLRSDGASAWRLVSAAGLAQVDSITSSGTVTVPWWARRLRRVRVWGGGGGGGGALNTGCSGSGGSAGGYSERLNRPVVPGGTYSVTIGAAGTAGAAGGGNGGAGGATSFGALCSATGGGGGLGASSGIQTTTPTPGAGSGGDLNLTGGSGSVGFITGNTSLLAGGFASMAPFGSFGNAFTVAAVGPPGNFPGGGGGGASANAAGGPGAAGYATAEWEA